jgi:hypothetical protein
MPGFLVHLGAVVLCAHGGEAQPTTLNRRVIVSGMPTTQTAAPYLVAGCPMATGGSPAPCLSAQWMTGATRVTSGGQPLVLIDSQAVCAPNGTPVTITSTQSRVRAH